MLYKNLIIALVLGVSAQSAYASEEIYTDCNTCSTDSEFTRAARSQSELNSTVVVHVMNMHEILYKKIQVTKTSSIECEQLNEPDGRGGKLKICRRNFKYHALNLTVENQELSDFTDYALAYNAAKDYFSQRSIEIPATVADTAFDLVDNSYAQGLVVNHFNNNSAFQDVYKEKLVTVVGTLSKMVNGVPTLTAPPLVFSFPDGTLAYAVLDFVDLDNQYHFTFIKIADGYNSLDLTKSNPFTGSYTFTNMSQSTWTKFFETITRLGLAVQGGSASSIPRGTVTIVAMCSSGKVCPSPE
jgi:hypothetical protein